LFSRWQWLQRVRSRVPQTDPALMMQRADASGRYAGAMPRSTKQSRRKTSSVGGELALIEHIRRRVGDRTRDSGELRLGIGDDCAILRPRAGEELVVTTDFSLEGRHFRRDWHSPESIGHRTLARGLSDLAA